MFNHNKTSQVKPFSFRYFMAISGWIQGAIRNTLSQSSKSKCIEAFGKNDCNSKAKRRAAFRVFTLVLNTSIGKELLAVIWVVMQHPMYSEFVGQIANCGPKESCFQRIHNQPAIRQKVEKVLYLILTIAI